jgi:hypothetical protein
MSEYGIPINDDRVNIIAELERPNGTHSVLQLNEVSDGVFEATFLADQVGVYPIRLLAKGKSLRGRPFTREHLLTAATWAGGDQPPPSTGNPQNPNDKICELLRCIFGGKGISEEAIKRLLALGIDIRAIEKCLSKFCRQRTTEVLGKPRVALADLVASKAAASVQPRSVDESAVQQLISDLGTHGSALTNIAPAVKKSSDCGCGK